MQLRDAERFGRRFVHYCGEWKDRCHYARKEGLVAKESAYSLYVHRSLYSCAL